MLKVFSLVRPFVRIPWWVKLLFGQRPRLRRPTLSSFYRWK